MKKTKRMAIGLQVHKIKIDLVNAGIDPELFDVRAHVDSSLSFKENRYNVANIAGYQIGNARVKSAVHRTGNMPGYLEEHYGRADEYNRAERNRLAALRRRERGPVPAKRMSRKKFKALGQLPLFQSDAWPYFPTEPDDKKRVAKPPGRRLSKTGHIYYERRRNRSDMPGTRL